MNVRAYRFGDFLLDVARRELMRGDDPVVLPARVFDCLEYLLQHRDRALGRDELISAVYGRIDVSDAQLGQLILRARRAVNDDGQVQHTIRTIPRFGFRWVAEAWPAPPVAATQAPGIDQQDPDDTQRVPGVQPVPEAVATPPALSPPPPDRAHAGAVRRRWWLPLAALCLLLAGAYAWHRDARDRAAVPAIDTRPPLAVLPARIDDGASEDWIRLGLMNFVGDHLRQAGLPVAPDDTVLALLPASAQDPDHLRARTGVDHVVESHASFRDGHWQVALAATDRQGIRMRAEGKDPALMAAARLATDRLLVALGHLPAAGGDGAGLDEQLQRAQAAMLANQLDLAREILTTATRLRRDDPLLRYHLVQVEYREGQYGKALAEIDALLSLPAGRVDRLLRAKLLNMRGAIGIRNDRYADAERDLETAQSLLRIDEHPAEWARGRSSLGITRMWAGRVEQAEQDLAQAREQMIRVGDAMGLARVDSSLGHVERLRDRPAQALEYFTRSAQDFESLGAINELVSVLSMVVDTQLQLLLHDQAVLAMQRYWGLRTRVRDPAQRAQVDLARIKVLMRLGRLREAGALLDPPQKDTRPTAAQLHHYALYRVELALASGQPGRALQLSEEALRLGGELSQPVRDWLRLYRARAAAAGEAPATGHGIALPPRGDASLPARLAGALVLQRSGQDEAAGAAFRAALDQAKASGTPALVVEVAWDYAPWLVARRRHAEAAELAGLLAPWARRDYRAARTSALLYAALGQPTLAGDAWADVARLAGERRRAATSSP